MVHDFPFPPLIKSYKIINQQGSWDGDLRVPLKKHAFFSGYFSTNCVRQVPFTPLKVFNLRSSSGKSPENQSFNGKIIWVWVKTY
jgi:hypothetical protein